MRRRPQRATTDPNFKNNLSAFPQNCVDQPHLTSPRNALQQASADAFRMGWTVGIGNEFALTSRWSIAFSSRASRPWLAAPATAGAAQRVQPVAAAVRRVIADRCGRRTAPRSCLDTASLGG